MPEFQVVDLTTKRLPPSVYHRLAKQKDLHIIESPPVMVVEGQDVNLVERGQGGFFKEVVEVR